MQKKILFSALIIVVIASGVFLAFGTSSTSQSPPTAKIVTKTTSQPTSTAVDSFNKKQFSLTNPTSIWVIVNKQHALQPKNYVPNDLVIPNIPLRVPGNESMQVRKVTASALESLFAGAEKDGLSLMLSSGYRSYTYQVNLYNGYVQSSSQAEADKTSARPGYSEHQTGLAADIEPASKTCEVETCFATTPEGIWLAANAYKYGFIIRYAEDKVAITGYDYEPWHVRYIGIDLATQMHNTHVETLEEFFGVNGGATYAP